MSLFKCKMCGGTLEVNNETVATCEYCGTQQTLPKLDDDKRVNMYDRANHFRRNNEFDKAMGIYEQILNEDGTDAEAYWSLVLCRYGIEYVEDPSSHKRIPTVNRAQFTSVFDDEDYKAALQNADGYQRAIYEEEAKAINEIQKGILAISQKEEPFDVFICYKETDNNGRRTPDSVLANDLYHQLTQEGFKVFFSRITLEDKLGTAYEPYIFAALNSAKVMVALGTKPEYFKAVWVKNEWSRYLSLIKQGQKKILIPAYKDMDPYDLPEEFSHLQAQDMSKLGFMQDLIRGIKKIAQEDSPKTTVIQETVVTAASSNTAPLLKRAFLFLEDGDWNAANEYSEKILDLDPECGEAYLIKLMVELQVTERKNLSQCKTPFTENNHYKKAMRFADDNLKTELNGYLDEINANLSYEQRMSIYSTTYNRAVTLAAYAKTEEDYEKAAQLFESLGEEYHGALERAANCRKMWALREKAPAISNALQEYLKITCVLSQRENLLASIATQIKELESYKEQFPKFIEERDSILSEQKLLRFEVAKLESEKASLGLFAGKQKAELKARINETRNRIENLNERLLGLQERHEHLNGYQSEADIDAKISKLQAEAEGLQNTSAGSTSVLLEDTYKEAIQLLEQGSYGESYNLFRLLKGYRDSKKYLSKFGVWYDKKETVCEGKITNTVTREFNPLQKLEKEIHSSLVRTSEHDSHGNLIKDVVVVSQLGNTRARTFQYDEQGNLIAITAASTYENNERPPQKTTVTFDTEGRRLFVTNDLTGKKESEFKYAYGTDGGWIEYCIDYETKKIDYKIQHDNRGNILEEQYGTTEKKYTYDEFSNRIREVGKNTYDGDCQKEFLYDEFGLCVKEQTTKKGAAREEEHYNYYGVRVVYRG